MDSKGARNLIIALIVVAIGIKLILWIIGNYIGSAVFSDLVAAFRGLGDLALYGLVIIAILLLPYYFSKWSKEKKNDTMKG